MAQFSRLYEGPGIRHVYMAKRMTHQLGNGEHLVPITPLQFTLFPYEAPDEIINLWRSSVCYLERLVEDGNFKEYQRSLMPALRPPHAVKLQSCLSESSNSCALCSITCIFRLLRTFQLKMDIEQPTLMACKTQSFLLGRFLYTMLIVPSPRFKSLDVLTSQGISFLRMLAL